MLIKIIPEIGHFALVIALLMAVVQAVMPLAGAATRRPLWHDAPDHLARLPRALPHSRLRWCLLTA